MLFSLRLLFAIYFVICLTGGIRYGLRYNTDSGFMDPWVVQHINRVSVRANFRLRIGFVCFGIGILTRLAVHKSAVHILIYLMAHSYRLVFTQLHSVSGSCCTLWQIVCVAWCV